MKKKILLVVSLIFLISNSLIPLLGSAGKTQQKSFQLNTQQDYKNKTDLVDRVFIKIFSAYFYYDHGSAYPVFCAIKIDDVFRGFSWKIGWMDDNFLSFYWSGFIPVGTHTLTVTTIIILEGFIRITESINVDVDSRAFYFYINFW